MSLGLAFLGAALIVLTCGLVSSLYVLTVNVIGYVIGPSALTLVSTSLLGGEQALGRALAAVCLVSAVAALALCALAWKPSR